MNYQTFKPKLATIGLKIISYPDHKGNSREGVIREVSEQKIIVDYKDFGSTTLLPTGKLCGENIDSSLDIGLIEK